MPNKNIALGYMSGTSCDGLTICAVQLQPFKVLAFKNYRYPKAIQQKLLRAFELHAAELSALHFEVGQLHAQKTKLFLAATHLLLKNILCAGMHGQTIYHGPTDKTPNTLQIGEPAYLAELLGCPVVSNFRERDMVLGGQGAPLMPFFDEYLFGKGQPKILLNLGGLSNISVVGKNIKSFGFDCGPANTLMDLACEQFLGKPFDKDGATAAKGTADVALVEKLLTQKYFRQKPPKSLDKNDFGRNYLDRYFASFGKARVADLLATLNYFTAASIARAIKDFVPARYQKEIIVSGGGVFNKTLMANLRLLSGLKVVTSAQCGLDPQAKEAAAFAVMGALALQGKTNHCPHATGARKKAILGRITL